MGRKLDLSGLTDNEAEHVLQVVQRDMRLRKKEEERLSELKQELDEEGSRCLLLSRQSCFNQRCCIRCCSPFTFLLNPKRQCRDCHYNVCKACRVFNKRDKAWLCSACQKTRLLKTQSLEWFYTNVKKRFKRFGSAKVLKTLYRKHLAEHSALSELTEGSAYEESICNEDSVCESDSTFYRQSEEHSMAETLTVALRVAEETIDEAIAKAEFNSASQKKQNEANYLREHRGELIEELAKTIVQKIINRRKTLAEMRAEYDQDWALGQNTDLHRPQSTSDQASSSLQHQPGLWRSHSAFSLSANDLPGLIQDSSQTLKKEGGGSAMSAWKSVDRLDNAGVSSVLKSPDGNWIALQSAQLSRPSLLTKRKSLVYSALERESGVVSAYEGMDSDNEAKPELDSSWGAVLQEIHRKMTDSNLNLQDTRDRITSTLMGHQSKRDEVLSDSEGNRKSNRPLLALFKRKLPAEIRRPSSSSHRTSVIDMNFNVGPAGEGERGSVCAEPEVGKIRRSRRKRRSKKEQVASSAVVDSNRKDNQSDHTSEAVTPDTLNSGATTPEPFDCECDISGRGANQMDEQLQLHEGRVSDFSTREEELDKEEDADNDDDDRQRVKRRQGSEDRGDEKLWKMEIDLDEDRTGDEKEEEERDLELDDEDMKDRLYRLVTQSSLTYFSSTDEELDKVCQSKGKCEEDKDEDMKDDDEETEGLTHRLCQLEKEVRATQFSSTEDELDRVAVDEKEEGEDEELVVKVCRLADQVNATQFSSTEDELDTAERGEEEEDVINEQTLWKLQPEKAMQAAQLRDLASLVSASQFSSTEDELDRVGENDRVKEQEANEGGAESSTEMEELRGGDVERRESFGDVDVKMFDFRDETEEVKYHSSDANVTDILDNPIKTEDVQQDNTEEDKPENNDLTENTQTREMKNERTGVEKQTCEEELEDEAERAKDAEEREEIKLRMVSEAVKMEEKTEEMKEINETRVEHENQPEAKWPDEKEGDRQGEEKFKVKWETTADSNEEDAEFDRIISSMLMMTFEDMQVETLKDEAAENGRVSRQPEDKEANDNVKPGGESGFSEKAVDTENTNASEETGSVRESQSAGDMRPESAVEESETEQTGEHVSRQQESRDATSRHENEQEEINLPEEKLETNEAEQTRETREADEEDRKETTQMQKGVTAEGESTNKEMDEKYEETEGNTDDMEQSSTSFLHEGLLSPQEIQNGRDMELYKTVEFISTLVEQRYSAASLRSITTEVLKVLNATEDLLQGVEGGDGPPLSATSLPPDSDPMKLDQQFSRLEENVYMAAGSVYSLEAELSDLEECARGICSSTSDMELSYLEEQVASAAAKVQQSELQICDISARIAALKSAGLNVDTQSRFKTRTIPVMPVTLDSSRQLRRRLPAPPVKEDKDT